MRRRISSFNVGKVGSDHSGLSITDAFRPAHIGNIRSFAFSPDSNLILTGGDDKQINVFDIKGLIPPKEPNQRNGATQPTNLRSRYNSAGQQVANLQGHTGWVLDLACRDDGKVFASSSSDG